MQFIARSTRLGLAATAIASAAVPAAANVGEVVLAPHRAVYDMKLSTTRTGSSITAVNGRMVYELTGSACEGWTQAMRFVLEVTNQESGTSVTDIRTNTWEDVDAKKFRFSSSQLRDQKPGDRTAGDAARTPSDLKVDLTQPSRKSALVNGGVMFPVQHSIELLKAAKAGKNRLNADLYDGSEDGEKFYDTGANIGVRLGAGTNRKLAQVKGADVLDKMPAWPIAISYYKPGDKKADAVPVYELAFLFFENGVSRKLMLDYGDYALAGELSDITFIEAAKCDPAKR